MSYVSEESFGLSRLKHPVTLLNRLKIESLYVLKAPVIFGKPASRYFPAAKLILYDIAHGQRRRLNSARLSVDFG